MRSGGLSALVLQDHGLPGSALPGVADVRVERRYVARETKRAIAGVNGEIPVYPGIDIDVPTEAGQKQTTPEDVRQAVKAAFVAGAQGVVLSRKYSE